MNIIAVEISPYIENCTENSNMHHGEGKCIFLIFIKLQVREPMM